MALRVSSVFHQNEVALSVAEQDRDQAKKQLVDEIRLEERAGEIASAHLQNVLARAGADLAEPGRWGLIRVGGGEEGIEILLALFGDVEIVDAVIGAGEVAVRRGGLNYGCDPNCANPWSICASRLGGPD